MADNNAHSFNSGQGTNTYTKNNLSVKIYYPLNPNNNFQVGQKNVQLK